MIATSRGSRRLWCRAFVRARRATVAVEFALIGLALLGMVLFITELSFHLYAQIALDYATARAARALQVDSAKSLSTTSTAFQSGTFCPLLAPFIACKNILITLRPVTTNYLSDEQANPPQTTGSLTGVTPTFSAGSSESLMLLQVTYVLPYFSWPLSSGSTVTYNGSTGTAIVSSAPYQNEY